MGDAEAFMLDYIVFIEQNIEVNIARAFLDDLFTAHGIFYVLQLV